MTIIKAGYRVITKSWENDWDNHQTNIAEGLCEKEVKLLMELANLFKDKNDNVNTYGNMFGRPTKSEQKEMVTAISLIVEKYKFFLDDDTINYLENDPLGYIKDLILGSSEFYTRAVESISVEWIPETIDIIDVTFKFKEIK